MKTTTNWQFDLQERRAKLLKYFLLASVWGGAVGLILFFLSLPAEMGLLPRFMELAPFLAVWLMVLVAWFWQGLGYQIRTYIVLLLVSLLGIYTLRRGGIAGMGLLWLSLLPVLGFGLGGTRAGIWSLAMIFSCYFVFGFLFTQGVFEPLVKQDPLVFSTWASEGISFFLVVLVLSVLLWAFNRDWRAVLFDVSQSNRQLRQQTARLQAATRVAHVGSSTLDPVELKRELVTALYSEFSELGVYFIGLYLLSEDEEIARLEAANSDERGALPLPGEKVTAGEDSPVGHCLLQRETQLVVGADYSQLALPLFSHDSLLGVLLIYGEQAESLDEGSREIFQTLANQVAMALANAQLFTQTEAALEEVQTVHRRYLVEGWQKYLTINPLGSCDYLLPGAEPVPEERLREARQAAITQGRIVRAKSAAGENAQLDTLAVPLKLRGQVIGTIMLHAQGRDFDQEEELTVIQNVAEQMALTVENLRLMDFTQRRMAREHLVQEITNQMQRATDLETLMRIASEELLDALGGSQVHVELDVVPEHEVAEEESVDV